MEINTYLDSISMVTTSPNFFFYMGLVVSFGMIVGGKLNEGMDGLKKSVIVLLPFGFVMLLTTSSRLFYTSSLSSFPLSANAYNGLFTLVFTSLFYLIGLVLGHTIVSSTIRKIYKEKGLDARRTQDLITR